MEPVLEIFKSQIVMKNEEIECQIIADDIEEMEPYVRALFNWATTVWDYNAVDVWNTYEYSLIDAQGGYFKVHRLEKDDKDGLFGGRYSGSPGLLKNYGDIEIHAYVYIKITKEEYEKLSVEEE